METTTRRRRVDTHRRRTGCQGCRNRRKKCDETRPQCVACVHRGVDCVYQRPLVFKGFNERTPSSSCSNKISDNRNSLPAVKQQRIPHLGNDKIPLTQYRQQLETADPHHKTQALCPSQSLPLTSTLTSLWPSESSSPSCSISLSSADPSIRSVKTLEPSHAHDILRAIEAETGYNDEISSIKSPRNQIQRHSSLTDHSQSWGESPRSTSDCSSSLAGSCPLSSEVEEALIMYFDQQVLPRTPVGLSFPQRFYKNSCFRAAVLALSSSFLSVERKRGHNNDVTHETLHPYGRNDKTNWLYYDAAVKSLNEQLEKPRNEGLEQLAGAALLLAYHDIEVGTPLGVRNHACGLDALASRMEFSTCLTPGLFKAWRMLRCDRKFLSLATRKTITAFDAYDMSSVLDRQIAIREVLIGLWKLHSRYFMEATFISNSQSGSPLLALSLTVNINGDDANNIPSPSERASQWLQLVLNRDCDRHQAQQRDFYSDSLTQHMMEQQCAYFAKQLDQWYEGLADSDMPVVKAGTDLDFVTAKSVSSVLITYRMASESKALDHILYLLSRMICNYLRSLFSSQAVAPVLEAWAKVILGIICGMNLRRQTFTLFRVDMLLLITALLSEGTNIVSIILEHVIPYLKSIDEADPGFFTWSYLTTILELVVRERLEGRAIRVIIDDSIQDSDQRHMAMTHRLVAFGDYNGKEQFRNVYNIE